MAYPSRFHRLVLAGKIYTEDFNFGMTIVPDGPGSLGITNVTPGLMSALATQLGPWFGNTTLNITNRASLVSFKLNSIDPDGHYTLDTTNEHVFTTPVAGGGSTSAPAQIATAVTLRTAAERGLASKGRFYLPTTNGFGVVGTDGRATLAAAESVASSCSIIINAINDAYEAETSGDEARGRVGVASKVGSGLFRVVTHVTVGRVPDTIRSRRSSLAEDPVPSPTPISPT